MSELSALAEKLAALISTDDVFDAGARVISQGGSPAPIAAILREIDETVLERNLEFKSETSTANLIVAGRRLRGILNVSSNATGTQIGETIAREEPELVQATFTLLSDLFNNATQLSVKSLAPEAFGKGGERGISARGLAALWNVEIDPTPLPPMERFLRSNAHIIVSFMHVSNDEIAATEGDFEALQMIWQTQVADFRKNHDRALNGEDGPQLICLEGVLDDGTSAALALVDNDIALLAYHTDQLGALNRSWRAIFH